MFRIHLQHPVPQPPQPRLRLPAIRLLHVSPATGSKLNAPPQDLVADAKDEEYLAFQIH